MKLELRLFVIFSLLIFAASLKSPLVSRSDPQWQVLEQAYGIRYWFFPMLAFVWSLLWSAQPGQSRWVRRFAVAMLVFMLIGIARDWEYPAFSNHNFAQYVKKFQAMPRDEAMLFPLYPDGWTMQLGKGSRICDALPTGFVDEPGNGAIVADRATLRGWVAAPKPVENIAVYLDGHLKQTIAPSLPRPDVDKEYPGGPVKDKGWRTSLDLSKASAGMHAIEVHARLKDGCEAVIGIRSIQHVQGLFAH